MELLRAELQRVVADLGVSDVDITLERPAESSHGDLATNVAMQIAKRLRRKPRELAEEVVARLDLSSAAISHAEIAGPGFINFWLAGSVLSEVLCDVLHRGENYGRSQEGIGRKVNVEFVSANPTGPLHVGHGRGAALGDAIAALLEATGHSVTREFYVNDAGVQIDRLAESVWARVRQAVGREAEIPEGGYHGEYLQELAQRILTEEGAEFADLPEAQAVERCRAIAVESQRAEQDQTLAEFGVEFDVVYNESSLYEQHRVTDTLDELGGRELTYEKDGALWFGTAAYGDEKDRVLRKSDGSYTYFLPDIAYHRDKAARGFDRAIDVWGADHHGYVNRMAAAMKSLGAGEDFFQAVLVQLVRVMRHGEEVRFSKRSGTFVALRDLIDETGVDAARYFFLMRKGDAQFVFDIDLATRQSDENPVYYVQYAHTRMAGIFRTAQMDPRDVTTDGVDLSLLSEPDEQALVKLIAEFPTTVSRAAGSLEPHRIVVYLEKLARLVNGWYHRHRVVGVGADLEHARLVLVRAAQVVLANGLTILGVTAPERM
ncbi:MAG: arginine--tRNA ligase [Gemmatimonadota bacterium]|nr:MAG: arginine--tRNA ligase [Gemmatimonadota bacterium]